MYTSAALKRTLLLLVVALLMLAVVAPAAAQSNATIVNASRLNLRSGPGAGYGVITVLSRGQQVNLLSSNADGSWFQVQTTSGLVGWVNSHYVSANVPGIILNVSQPTTSTNAVVTTPFLNVRGGPGANFPDLGNLAQGQGVDLIGRNADNSWVQINVPGGIQGGWVSSRYISASVPIGWLPLTSNTGISPTYPQPVPTWGATGIVTAPNLNVRYGPGVWFSPFTRLSAGEGVSLVGRNANASWLLVQLANGTTGWVSSGFIRTSHPIWSLEVRG